MTCVLYETKNINTWYACWLTVLLLSLYYYYYIIIIIIAIIIIIIIIIITIIIIIIIVIKIIQYFLNQEQVIAEGRGINTVDQDKEGNVQFA